MDCISSKRQFYRLYDPDPGKGCFHVADTEEAFTWNEKQWGVFWTVNQFKNLGERKKESIERILSWAVDIDEGTKQEQIKLIQSFAEPSLVIETKRGYQVYYDAIDASLKNFDEITSRVIRALNGDQKAKDLCRILRVPAFVHWKDPNDPFPVKMVYSSAAKYSEKNMLAIFPAEKKSPVSFSVTNFRRELSFQKDDSLFERVYSLNCEEALRRISGTEASGHETISFRPAARGHLNIFIGLKPTSCFIDSNKRIGGGGGTAGPTVWQWIYYYLRDHKEVYRMFQKYFPEVIDGKPD